MTTNLYQIGRWAEHSGLVGEKHNFLVGAVVAISAKPMGFGIEAPAGSGKTVVADLLIGDEGKDTALIYNKYIYFKDAGSSTSFFWDADKINQKKIVAIKELQKDKSHEMVEAIKSLTEGKSANRRRTDVTVQGVVEQKIQPKPVIYTLAIENDTKPDAELRRRCICVSTDVSQEQTRNVLALKAQLRFDRNATKILTEDEAKIIRQDVNQLLNTDFTIVNPFAEAFVESIASIAPDQKVRSMAEHFWDVMEGVAKVNYMERTVNGMDMLFCNVQDLYQTLDIFKSAFIRDVYSIPPLGDIVLRGFDDASLVEESVKTVAPNTLSSYGITDSSASSQWIDVNHLRKAIKEKQRVVLAKNVVIQICRQLVDAGYLEDWKDGQVIKYQVQQEFKEFINPDWAALVADAAGKVKAKYPGIYDKWYAQQWLPYTHPITGDAVQPPEKADLLDELADDVI